MGVERVTNRDLLIAAGVSLATLLCGLVQVQADDLWVLNQGSRLVKVVDSENGTLLRTIPLHQDPGEPEPGGLAFATVDSSGLDAEYAFVAQGGSLHVIPVDDALAEVAHDIADWLGQPLQIVDLASGPNRSYDPPEITAHLFAIADIDSGEGFVPSYIVFDQEKLIRSPGLASIVASGPLQPALDPILEDAGESSGVTTPTLERGDATERAIYSVVVEGVPRELRTLTLVRDADPIEPWRMEPTLSQSSSIDPAVPAIGLRVAAPRGRELPVVPDGGATLRAVGSERGCALEGELVDVAIAGPGPSAFQTLLVDRAGKQLLQLDGTDCEYAKIPLNRTPARVTIASRVGGTAWVSHPDDAGVSRVAEDGQVNFLALAGDDRPTELGLPGTCQGCQVGSYTLTTNGNGDHLMTWQTTGCSECDFQVWCKCLAPGPQPVDENCDCHCSPYNTPTCKMSNPTGSSVSRGASPGTPLSGGVPDAMPQQPWKQLGNSLAPTYTHPDPGNWGVKYTIVPIPETSSPN